MTFLSGQDVPRAAKPPLVAGPRLSLADGLRLLQTPSSEAGVQAYHRALEGAAAGPATLLAELSALREGRSTRFELIAEVASSPQARTRGVGGPGFFLIRIVRKAFVASGVAVQIRARRALITGAQDARLATAGTPIASADIARRLVSLEGALMRLENKLFARARDAPAGLAALESRVMALEAEAKLRLLNGLGSGSPTPGGGPLARPPGT